MAKRQRTAAVQNSQLLRGDDNALALAEVAPYASEMKLCQGQTWRRGDTYFRIAKVDRLSVDYKLIENLTTKEGGHHHATKKEFCRLIKSAVLMTPREVAEIRDGVKVIDLPTGDSKEAPTKSS